MSAWTHGWNDDRLLCHHHLYRSSGPVRVVCSDVELEAQVNTAADIFAAAGLVLMFAGLLGIGLFVCYWLVGLCPNLMYWLGLLDEGDE